MKIKILLKNNSELIFPDCTFNDFESLVSAMRNMKSSFVWNEKIWVNKKEVACFELQNDSDATP